MQADSEARIALLRKKSKKGKSKEEDQAEKALDKQLKGKGREDVETEARSHRPKEVERSDDLANIITKDGHCELRRVTIRTQRLIRAVVSQFLGRSGKWEAVDFRLCQRQGQCRLRGREESRTRQVGLSDNNVPGSPAQDLVRLAGWAQSQRAHQNSGSADRVHLQGQ